MRHMDTSEFEIEWFARIAATIHTHGHMIIAVGSGRYSVPGCPCPVERRPWAYTVGRCQTDQP